MQYNALVLEHFRHPRNVGELPKDDPTIGCGRLGTSRAGDVMQLHIKVEKGIVSNCACKVYGSVYAIACLSLASELLKGKKLAEVKEIDHIMLAETLDLPSSKLHCAIMASDVIKMALEECAHAR